MFAGPRRRRAAPRANAGSLFALVVAAAVAACGGNASGAGANGTATGAAEGVAGASGEHVSGSIELYTSVTQDTVDAVVRGLTAAAPGLTVNVFRAATGQLNARIAADERSGGLRADVLWLTDPLSMGPLEQRRLLWAWTPPEWTGLPGRYRTAATFGTRLLNLVIVAHEGVVPRPSRWQDLTDAAYRNAVAIPDPVFAGSAFGALAYFAQSSGYGLDYYRRLKSNGAVQVQGIADVVTGVAQGRFKAGMTLDNTARAAIAKGSPITMIWPSSGAIAVLSPIAVAANSRNRAGAEAFVDYVLSDAGQKAIGGTGWQPIRPRAGGPPPGGPQVQPDWAAATGEQTQLLDQYHAIFGD